MLKYIIMLFTQVLLVQVLFSQQGKGLFPVETAVDSIAFKVVEVNGRLQLGVEKLPAAHQFASITALYLQDADMVLAFSFNGKNEKFSQASVKILGLKKLGSNTVIPVTTIVNKDTLVQAKRGTNGQRIWQDAAEEILNLGSEYYLLIARSQMDDINCALDKRPEFKQKQYVPHIAIGVLSVGAIGIAQVFKVQRNDAYETYKNQWRNGEVSSIAAKYYKDAQKKDDTAKILNTVGWSTLALNAIFTYARLRTIKIKQKRYDKFCVDGGAPTLSLSPSIGDESFGISADPGLPRLKIGIQF